MNSALDLLAVALTIGITGAVQPGPFTVLVISQSLRYGTREGLKIALAPLITDMPIIFTAIFILSKISNSNTIVGTISLLGAGYLAYLGYGSITSKALKISNETTEPQSLKKGIITNFLSPGPYLFWITIGAAMLTRAIQISVWMPAVFIVVLYATFVSCYMIMAFVVGKFRNFLESKLYVAFLRLMGLVLGTFSALFFIRGLKLLGLL